MVVSVYELGMCRYVSWIQVVLAVCRQLYSIYVDTSMDINANA